MISLLLAFAVLIVGFLVYSRVVEKVFAPDDRVTPAIAINDGVDCVPMKTWKVFLVQFLNIAGTGPIFGALMGAVFGPIVFLWIVFGSILGGAVHDYMVGMISSRNGGKSIAELSGQYLGKGIKYFMRVFSIVLLLLTGTVFITSPAALLAKLTPESLNATFWLVLILLYYLLACILPIDKLIGRLYPIFGLFLFVMAGGILFGIVTNSGVTVPELSLQNLHPDNLPVWPFMFVTVACGAISGFHATQSPMAAKCIKKEKDGRCVFYGAMIAEAVIALVWAAGGVAFYGTSELLNQTISELGQASTVYEIAKGLLGDVGGVLAIVGVVVCPITSGDTALRSARLVLAESFHLKQKRIRDRLLLTVPILLACSVLAMLQFDELWRLYSWSNQTLAMAALWVGTAYLLKEGKGKWASLMTALPATFMSAVSVCYILEAPEGFGLGGDVAYPLGLVCVLACFSVYLYFLYQKRFSGHGKHTRMM